MGRGRGDLDGRGGQGRVGGLTLAALLSATFAGSYYSNVALVPLAPILDHFHTGVGMGVLVLGAFAVTLAATTPLASHLGDRGGWTRVLVAGLAVVAVGSVAAALSPSFAFLVGVRVVQGAAAAVIVPGVMIHLSTTVAERDRPFAMGLWSSANSLGRLVAVPLGGLLASLAGWSSVFWSSVPAMGIAALAIFFLVPRKPPRPIVTDWSSAGGLTAGAALGLGGLTALSTGVDGAVAGVPLMVAGAALVATAWRRGARASHPLVPVGLLRSPTLLRSSLGGFVQMATIMVDITAVSLYLVRSTGTSPATAGLVALAFPGVMVVVSWLAGYAMRRLGGRRVFSWGLGLLAVGQVLIALATARGVGVGPLLAGALGLAGGGAALVQTSSAGGATRPGAADSSAAVGAFNLIRFSGTAAGAAWLAIVLSLGGSYPLLFASCAAVAVGSLALSSRLGGEKMPLGVKSP